MREGSDKSNDEQKKEVGKRIKELRTAKGWNQQKLADEADLTQSAIAQFEKGERLPSTTALQSMAKAFGISMESLLTQESNTDPNKILQLGELMTEAKGLSTDQILTLNRLVKDMKPKGETQ